MKEPLKWLSREGWAQNQRAFCWEGAEEKFSKLSAIATEAQIAEARVKLREHWKELGRQLRATTDDRERMTLRWKRHDINGYLEKIKENRIPFGPHCKDIIGPFRDAREKAVEGYYEQIVGDALTDAAWGQELQRREQLYAKRPDLVDDPKKADWRN